MTNTITNFPDLFKSNFIRLPKPLIQIFGLETTLFLSELFTEYQYWFKRKQLTKDYSFYSTVENVFNNTGLSRHIQEKASKQLEEYGLIKKTHYGMPAKRYFRFEQVGIKKLLADINQLKNNTDETQAINHQEEINISIDNTPAISSADTSHINTTSTPAPQAQSSASYCSPYITKCTLTAEDLGRTSKYQDFMFY